MSRRFSESRRVVALAAAVLTAVGVAGCGRGVRLVPVSGVVEVDGKPLSSGAITVVPGAGRAASGRIGKDGRFTLSTFETGDGAIPGRHRVVVTAHEELGRMRLRWLVPDECRELADTPLVLDIDGPTSNAKISIATDGKPLRVQDMSVVSGDLSPTGTILP